MDYTLTKELKHAGFPLYEIPEPYNTNGERLFIFNINGVSYRIPTLEELIEACGDRFGGLTRMILVVEEWTAHDTDDINIDAHGITPIEAVAKLWLALNKK